MDKLSELSKPVDICNWKMDSWRAAPCNGTEWAKGYFEGWNKYHQKVEGLAPLYSQEYVSALLAELEKAQRANNSAPTILRQLAEEKQKRGEVAAATAFNYAASALQKELSK